ncbi:aldo/keto reductase [soil metagenome]
MQPRRLARECGLMVSPLALGTAAFGDPGSAAWNVGADAVWPLVSGAFDRGITLFDTGSTYGGGLAETRLGAALARLGNREQVAVTTKIFFPTGPGPNDRGLSRKHLIATLDRSLARLQTDYVDLLMIHRFDPNVPIEETLTTLDGFVRSGRVRYLGASSMSAWRLMKMLGLQRANNLAPFVAMQGHYNLLYREEEREMIPLCEEEGLGYLAWSPLARGRLAGGAADPVRLKADRRIAERSDSTLDARVLEPLDRAATPAVSQAQIALAWLASRGAIPVIGASTPAEIDLAVKAIASPRPCDFAPLEAGYRPQAVLGFDPKDERRG